MTNRRDVMALTALAALAGSRSARGAKGPALPNAVMSGTQVKLTREPFGDHRVYFDGFTDQLGAMTAGSLLLRPGMTPHAPHKHPEEEFMVVTEGTGEISIDGKITRVSPGAIMYCAANHMHGIVNTGKTPLNFYYFKWKA